MKNKRISGAPRTRRCPTHGRSGGGAAHGSRSPSPPPRGARSAPRPRAAPRAVPGLLAPPPDGGAHRPRLRSPRCGQSSDRSAPIRGNPSGTQRTELGAREARTRRGAERNEAERLPPPRAPPRRSRKTSRGRPPARLCAELRARRPRPSAAPRPIACAPAPGGRPPIGGALPSRNRHGEYLFPRRGAGRRAALQSRGARPAPRRHPRPRAFLSLGLQKVRRSTDFLAWRSWERER